MAETEEPIWGDELEDYLDLGTEGEEKLVKVTNLLSWEHGDDQVTYEPDYIDVKVAPTYILANKGSIEYEKDAYRNNELDTWLISHEDETNIPVSVVRVMTWDGEPSAQTAKKALFLLTPKQLDKNSAGEPVKLKGTLSMKDSAWTKGTFDSSTKKFTAGGAAAASAGTGEGTE